MGGIDVFEDVSNPLDSVEDVIVNNDWAFDRPTSEELIIHVSGRYGQYRLTFLWQEDYSALQFFCEFDLSIRKERLEMARKTVAGINEDLWLGHFDIPETTRIPCFRHTTLFRGLMHTSGVNHVHDLIEIAMAECERYYNAFNMLSCSVYLDESLMDLALIDKAGEA